MSYPSPIFYKMGEGFPFACLPDFIKNVLSRLHLQRVFLCLRATIKTLTPSARNRGIVMKKLLALLLSLCLVAALCAGCGSTPTPRRRRQHHNHPRGTRYRSLRRSERAHLHGNGQAPVRQRCRGKPPIIMNFPWLVPQMNSPPKCSRGNWTFWRPCQLGLRPL